MTWVIAVWSALMLVWLAGDVTVGKIVLVLVIWVMGFAVLSVLWYMTRPLWRHGRGLRWRRLRSL